MSNTLESALADEVLAQVAARRYTHKEMQQLSGIRPRTWGNYFVQRDRAIPFAAVEKIAAALGMKASELMALAEARAEADKPTPEQVADQLLATLPADARRDIARVAEGLRPKPAEDDPPMAAGDH